MHVKTDIVGAGERAQLLRALANLTEDPSSIPIIHIIPTLGDPMFLASVGTGTYTHIPTHRPLHTHIRNSRIMGRVNGSAIKSGYCRMPRFSS